VLAVAGANVAIRKPANNTGAAMGLRMAAEPTRPVTTGRISYRPGPTTT
jgi:hypothetical protein